MTSNESGTTGLCRRANKGTHDSRTNRDITIFRSTMRKTAIIMPKKYILFAYMKKK
jgi:hypothetical protein